MKIMQIMPEFGLAGAEIMCEDLSHKLYEKGIDVIVVSLFDYHSPITDRLEAKGIKVIYLDKKPGLDLSMIFKLYKLFNKEKPDAIHTHRHVLQYAIPAAVLSKIKKRVHTMHNIATKENGTIGRKFNKIFFKFCNVIPVALSDIVKETVVEEYKLKEEKIPVVFNGIDLSKCIKKIDYTLHEPIKIIHIGRFAKAKNHVNIVKATEVLKNKNYNFVLSFYGDGSLKEEIENLVLEKQLNDCVKFKGLASDISEKLNESDIFILPSIFEGMPMTIIEAMGTGVPMIVTSVGGVPEMVKDYKETLYCNTDFESIAEKIEELILNIDLRKQLGENAYKKSQIFSSENMAGKYISIYREE